MQPVFEIPDIVSSEEVNDLLNYYSSLETVPDSDAITPVIPIEETPFYFIVDRLKERLGNAKVVTSYFLDSITPWPVHSDFGVGLRNRFDLKTDNYPYYTTLIPLEHQQDMYTVVFNEPSYESPQWANKDWSPTWHLPESNYEFTDFEKELLTHVATNQPNCLSKLSIKKIYKWVPGTAICWPRHLLHCSGYFNRSLSKRIAITVWFGLENP